MENKNGRWDGKQLKVSREALGLVPANDVKGGLVIEQMKRYAKRWSQHTGDSVNIRIEVWHHPASGSTEMHDSVDFILWDSANSRFIEIPYPDDDLRAVGREIENRIVHEKAADKRSKFTDHVGE
jgi:hypothetical protein